MLHCQSQQNCQGRSCNRHQSCWKLLDCTHRRQRQDRLSWWKWWPLLHPYLAKELQRKVGHYYLLPLHMLSSEMQNNNPTYPNIVKTVGHSRALLKEPMHSIRVLKNHPINEESTNKSTAFIHNYLCDKGSLPDKMQNGMGFFLKFLKLFFCHFCHLCHLPEVNNLFNSYVSSPCFLQKRDKWCHLENNKKTIFASFSSCWTAQCF